MMKHKYTFAALAAFAFMFASQAWAVLPRPTSATFAKGAKFTVAGYTNATGTARSELSNFPVLVRIAADSPVGFSYGDLASSTGDACASSIWTEPGSRSRLTRGIHRARP